MVWSLMGRWRLPIALTVITVGLLSLLSYNGFCFTQGRFLDQQALYRAAASQVLNDQQIHLPNGRFFSPEHPIAYGSVDAFLSSNPGCCSLLAYLPVGGFDACVGRLVGAYRAHIEVRFLVRYLGADGVVHSAPEVRHVLVSNCGEAYLDS